MKDKKALIAMSGGVDSSVAAYLMHDEGWECAGAIMRLCDDDLPGVTAPEDSIQDARSVAQRIGMPFYVFDNTQDFKNSVIDPFIRCYETGGTPNPCVQCNRRIKFGAFLDKALEMGFSHVVTGHYATVEKDENTGRYLLYRAADRAKDQSYFLAGLNQEQLAHIQFPLGKLSKEQARQIAEAQGFINARKRDSQDICFIPDGDYVRFMKEYTGKDYPTGDYLDIEGNIVGKHAGAVSYTIGQRKGLGIALGEPVYVCCKDMDKNTVTVGKEDHLFRKSLRAENWNWIPFPTLADPIRVTAKVRYRHIEQPATVYPEAGGTALIEFDEPQRAITTGQAVVLYDGDKVIGSATSTEVL